MTDPGGFYTIRAWWPNSTVDPETKYTAHLADALDWALALMRSHKHTTIHVTTPDRLELVKLWGQPMPNGKNWP